MGRVAYPFGTLVVVRKPNGIQYEVLRRIASVGCRIALQAGPYPICWVLNQPRSVKGIKACVRALNTSVTGNEVLLYVLCVVAIPRRGPVPPLSRDVVPVPGFPGFPGPNTSFIGYAFFKSSLVFGVCPASQFQQGSLVFP